MAGPTLSVSSLRSALRWLRPGLAVKRWLLLLLLGVVTLRRPNVGLEGSPEQLAWRIYRIAVQ